MVFLGTSIAGGSARALVVATGMRTELGLIAQLLDTAESGTTPLQKRLDSTARYLLWACLAIVALVFLLGLLRSIAPFELFLSAISLAVAAIPEGLPAVSDGGSGAGCAAYDPPQRLGAALAIGRNLGLRGSDLHR